MYHTSPCCWLLFTCGEQSGYVHFGELLLSVSSGEPHPTSLVVGILDVHFGELLLGVSSVTKVFTLATLLVMGILDVLIIPPCQP